METILLLLAATRIQRVNSETPTWLEINSEAVIFIFHFQIAPISGFVNDDTAYRYYETPKMAVFDGMKPIPTGDDCQKLEHPTGFVEDHYRSARWRTSRTASSKRS
ncbi:hypothetical protein L3Y34_013216 [Caenorhabditis briggsae]|uniref:Uncharacterized protein n=1 Tax=Caenorhabditis briggsae TaxID=6238 RepID=A0AAE9CXJ1_CAEBR|nr:hypothetical protein L3Y34_013216 [Caenorhabditis briggsae]